MRSASPSSRLDSPKAAPRNAYLIGTGIAALAAAAYLLKEGGLPGPNIVLFEQMEQFGGSLDAHGNPKEWICHAWRAHVRGEVELHPRLVVLHSFDC
ncbi:oleate hydratase [Bradyrhizobium ivorense]|uniref:oleate hydratase n=1 Tax=Bradyrhizobium ivorense TaxID=2511166 RepID=UPI0024BFC0C1|nr:oleate hydratase [Bradyrhizobium ivorense]